MTCTSKFLSLILLAPLSAMGQSYYQGTPTPCSLALIFPDATVQLASDSCTWHKMVCGLVCPYEVDLVEPVTATAGDPSLSYQVFPESSAISFVNVLDVDSNVLLQWRVTHSGTWTFTISNRIYLNSFDQE